jgi:hypothetical protein
MADRWRTILINNDEEVVPEEKEPVILPKRPHARSGIVEEYPNGTANLNGHSLDLLKIWFNNG